MPINSVAQIDGETLGNQFVREVQRQDLQAVQRLIERGADVDFTQADGSTALLWAVYQQDIEMVHALIDADADLNVMNRYGITPLLQACRTGNSELVFALLEAGADTSLVSAQLETPLMSAAKTGMLDVVRQLLEHGADVNAQTPAQLQTALMWAAQEGHSEVVRLLLEAGADPDLTTKSKVAELVRYTQVDFPLTESGRAYTDFPAGAMTALMFAAREGHINVARVLLEAGADIAYADPSAMTALLTAIINDELDMAALLLDYGANPNDGALYELVELHNVHLGVVVGTDNSRPRQFRENQITPLELMNIMLDAGGDPYFRATHEVHTTGRTGFERVPGASAYVAALTHKDVSMLEAMLNGGHATADYAGAGESAPLVTLMATTPNIGSAGFGGTVSDIKRYPEGSRDMVEAVYLLLDYGAEVAVASELGETPLHLAARANHVDLIQEFYERGAGLFAETAAGLTALDYAMGQVGNSGGGRGRGGPPPPQPEAIALLRELMEQ